MMTRLIAAARFWRREGGATLVEFALVLPVVLLVIIGILDFGRAVTAYVTMSNASREGLRYATLHPASTPDAIKESVVNRSSPLNAQQMTVRALYSNDDGGTWREWTDPGAVKMNKTAIRIEVSYPWSAATAFVGRFISNGSVTFTTTSTGLAQLDRP